MTTPKKNPQKVVTGVVRSSFMFLNNLEEDDKGNKKCKSMFIIPKKDKTTIAKCEKAIDAASQKKFGKKANRNSRSFGYPLRDADKEHKEGTLPESIDYKTVKGCYFLNSNAYKLPGLVDADNEVVEDKDERESMLVPGYYFKVSLTFKGYDTDSKGVRAEINNLMFIKEGERLDGGVAADSEEWDSDGSDYDGDEDEGKDESGSDTGSDYTPEKIKELCAELKEEDEDALNDILEEFDCKNARAASKLDDDERADLGEALEEALD